MSERPILFWAQRYQDGDYHARAYDPVRNLVSGVRAGDTLETALHKAANSGLWFVTEWRDEVPDGEQYELIEASLAAPLKEVLAELNRATAKFPTWPTDPIHAVAVVAEEIGELQKEVLQLTYEPHKSTRGEVKQEAIQLAAMSLRFLISLEQYQYRAGEQHAQAAIDSGKAKEDCNE